jgi:thioesterase domain-containing protein
LTEDPLATEVESIAGYYLQEIRRVQSEGCYFLGGFSFGGTVAFEMAQQLKRNGEEVAFLVLLDSRFPGTGISDSPERQKQAIITGAAVHRHWTNLASLGTREQLNYLWMRVKGKIKDKIKESQIGALARNLECKACLALGRRLPVTVRSRYILNTYHRARVKYSPRSFPGRALYIKTNMRSGAHQSAWGRLMVGGLDVHEVPGG